MQFGEGGAGTFSDGKLTTRSKDPRCHQVLRELVHFGAPKEILYQAHPHIGTDILVDVVRALREEVIALGGEIRFVSQVEDLIVEGDACAGSSSTVRGSTVKRPYWRSVTVPVIHFLYYMNISCRCRQRHLLSACASNMPSA